MGPPLPRDQFAVTERCVYLDHAAIGPLPRVAVDAITAISESVARGGTIGILDRIARLDEVRAAGARLMGVAVDDIAFVKNTTEGLGFVASGLDWRPGDRVIVPDLEFPSTLFPWLALQDRGVVVTRVEPVGPGRRLPLERFADALRAGPARVVCTSWVQFGRGWRTDLAGLGRLCAEHGALLVVDVIQGLGAIPVDLAAQGVHVATADAHKWLLGPEGAGLLSVAPEVRPMIRPVEPGWASVTHRMSWDDLTLELDPSARRYEGGTLNAIGIAGMGASIDLLLAAGIDRVWEHIDGLCDRAVEGLTAAGATVLSDRSPDGRSGIVTFTVDGLDPVDLWGVLGEQGVIVSPRGGGIRVAPHGYNTVDDIDALVAAVAHAR